jgi:hypothetical protein
MRTSQASLRLVAAVVAAAAAVAGATTASGSVNTTEPTNFQIFNVRLGPTGVAFKPTPTTTSGTTGEFRIYNASGKQRRFALAGRGTKLIRTKRNTIFFLLFDRTGTFTWTSSGPNAKTFKGTFQVTQPSG